MPRGRPKKLHIENEVNKVEEIEIEIESENGFGDSKEDLGFRNDRCFQCGRDCEPKCAKGDHNQFKFCSIECFNKDKT